MSGFTHHVPVIVATGVFAVGGGGCGNGDETCVPSCEAQSCGDDGCGGTCGLCESPSGCDEHGTCQVVEACTATCDSLFAQCGEICGVSCGTCTGENEVCVENACLCAPVCEGLWCTDSDSCGGICEPCPNEENCSDCPLKLYVVERTETASGQVTDVTLAVDYVGDVPATMADIRMEVSGPVQLLDLEVGEAISNSGKSLQKDPDTGEETLILPDGTHRWTVFSLDDQTPLGGGRWLTLRFRMGAAFEPALLPGIFALRDDDVTLTPPAAEAALLAGGITTPVVVWYETVEGAP